MKHKILLVLLAVAFLALYACSAGTYTVTFDACNGTDPVTLVFDDDFSLPDDPTREGYVFGGWFTDSACTNKWSGYGVKSDITVYAKWTADVDKTPVDISSATYLFTDYSDWNFSADYVLSDAHCNVLEKQVLKMYGYNVMCTYGDSANTDYLAYDEDNDLYYYLIESDDGTYVAVDEDDPSFAEVSDMLILELSTLDDFDFYLDGGMGDVFTALDPAAVGNEIFGEFSGATYDSLSLTLTDGLSISDYSRKITLITASLSDTEGNVYTITLSLYDYGASAFTLPGADGQEDDESVISTSVFTDENLTTESSDCIQFTSSHSANAYVTDRGVQFLQSDGTVTLTSTVSVKGVTKVVLSLMTNQTSGMTVSVKVGETSMTSDSAMSVKFTASTLSDITFVCDKTDGVITITLAPAAKKKSMYISSVTVTNTEISGGTASGVMPSQKYDASTFDYSGIQEKSAAKNYGIGLPSKGEYSALVIPVQFSSSSITTTMLSNLNTALNGTAAETGWQSVSSYYYASSYGMLDLSFDIWGYTVGTDYSAFTASKTAAYYEANDDNSSSSLSILNEALAYVEDKIDLTKYDTNDDGLIDAVYLIYDHSVDYDGDSDLWWAYVYWDDGETTYDGLYAYYYMFAGFEFMDEDVEKDGTLKINAVTYIHETGHLLGLDDYYDYYTDSGSNQGLGGAAMMDYNMGDQDVYSKTMLGWLKPTVITSSQEFTIDLSDAATDNDCVMILLDSDNSYFCEYLMIDLYSATGLNAFHSSDLYGGASYGARIYHVNSWANNPYSDDYGSFTDCNNSLSSSPLIKLVEADGETSKSSKNYGLWAAESDLWQAGTSLSKVFPSYARSDGKTLNFDITFTSVSATQVKLTVTFY